MTRTARQTVDDVSRRAAVAPDLLLCFAVIPAYRQGFLDALAENAPGRIEVATGDVYFTPGMSTAVTSPLLSVRAHNRLFLGRRFLWQSHSLRPALAARITVIDINPRLLLPWVVLVLRRLLGRPTVGFGHAHPRSGPTSRTTPLRRVLQRRCDELLTYTAAERDDLRAALPGATVTAAPNALYRRVELYRLPRREEATEIIVPGRLVDEKRPQLALRSFALALPRLPDDAVLRMVGDGPLMARCRVLASTLGIEDRVRFEGRTDDLVRLRELFSDAAVLLSPGYVGLNAIQALGFGTPVVYPDDEPHAPEVTVLDADNSEQFAAGDPASCADALVRAFGRWRGADREGLAARYATQMAIEAMVAPFHRLAQSATTREEQREQR